MDFFLCGFQLIFGVLKVIFRKRQALGKSLNSVIEADNIAVCVIAERNISACCTFQSNLIISLCGIKKQLRFKPSVLAERNRVGAVHLLAGFNDCFTGVGFFGIKNTLNLHTDKAVVRWFRVLFRSFYILLQAFNAVFQSCNSLRIIFDYLIFQSVFFR